MADTATRRATVIDPVLDYDHRTGKASTKSADAILEAAADGGLQIDWVLETHAHADHLSGAPYLKLKTGAKVGIDATIPEGIPHERYERISYAYADKVKLGSYKLTESAVNSGDRRPAQDEIARIANRIAELIGEKPLYYAEVIDAFPDVPLQAITRAFGKLHVDERLWQDPDGRMCLRGSKFAAKPPGQGGVR